MESGDNTVAMTGAAPINEGVGAMLRARRLALGLSQSDIANMVKLSARRIEALENERWEELPNGPFLRGFLRNVARALNLDAAALIEKVDASLTRSSSPDSIFVPQGVTHATLPRRSGPADDRRGGRTLVYGAFLFALIAALIAWSGTESFDRTIAAAKGINQAPTTVAMAPTASAASRIGVSGASVTPTPASPDQAAAGKSPASALALLFHFNEESWVEVRSADGKVLLQRLNAAGSEQEVDGEAPFSLVVGNAKGVALKFRGQTVDLTPYTRDSVARLKLS